MLSARRPEDLKLNITRFALVSVFSLSLALASAGAAPAATVTGDPGHSSATFSVQHLAITTVTGTIPVLSWSATTNADNIPVAFSATLDAKGIDTKNPDRDKDLRGSDWLNTDKYPTLTFKSTKVVPGTGGAFQATGDLTVNGITKPVTFAGKYQGSVETKYGLRAGYSAMTTINRFDFGLNFGAKTPGGTAIVGSDVTLTLEAEGAVKP